MYKLSLFLITFSLFSPATAAYNNQNQSEYDLETGLYIHVVGSDGERKANYSSKTEGYSAAINLFVFNPKDNTYRHLFDKNYGEITSYVIETAFQQSTEPYSGLANDKSVMRGSYTYLSGNDKAQNNTDIAKRAINTSIIIETYNSKSKDFTVWKANKLAGKANVLFSYHLPAEWHLDVKNQQIRLITPGIESQQIRLHIKSYAW